MLQISLCIFYFRVLPPYLISSPVMLSVPAALFVFSLLIIVQISLNVGGAISSWLSVLSLVCCNLSGVVGTLKRFWKYYFHLASTSLICDIVLSLVSLQVAGKINCWGLKVLFLERTSLCHFFFGYILFVIFCCSPLPFSSVWSGHLLLFSSSYILLDLLSFSVGAI